MKDRIIKGYKACTLIATILIVTIISINYVHAESAAPGVAYNYTKNFLEKVAAGTYVYILDGENDCAGYINTAIAESGLTMPVVGGIPSYSGGTIGWTGNWTNYIRNIGEGGTINVGGTVFTAHICGTNVDLLRQYSAIPGTIVINNGHAAISLGEFPSSWSTDQVADRLEVLYGLSNNLNGNNAQGKPKVWDKTAANATYFGNIWRVSAASAQTGLYIDNAYGGKDNIIADAVVLTPSSPPAMCNITYTKGYGVNGLSKTTDNVSKGTSVSLTNLITAYGDYCSGETFEVVSGTGSISGTNLINCDGNVTVKISATGCNPPKICKTGSYTTEEEADEAAKKECTDKYTIDKNTDECYEYKCEIKTCENNSYITKEEANEIAGNKCLYGYTVDKNSNDCYEYICKTKTCQKGSFVTQNEAEEIAKKECTNGYTTNINQYDCYEYICKESTNDNPTTGNTTVIFVCIIGLLAIGYSAWYYTRMKNTESI